ncbi:MAG: hypothetical protein AAFN48_13675, partial [Pseudomonadota bacterium]
LLWTVPAASWWTALTLRAAKDPLVIFGEPFSPFFAMVIGILFFAIGPLFSIAAFFERKSFEGEIRELSAVCVLFLVWSGLSGVGALNIAENQARLIEIGVKR